MTHDNENVGKIVGNSPKNIPKNKFGILRETINIPFLADVVAIILSSIPYISEQAKNENSIINKFLIGIIFSI